MDGPPETTNPPEVGASEGPKGQSGGDRLGDKDTPRAREDYARARYDLHGQIRRHLIGYVQRHHKPGTYAGNVYRTAACTWVQCDDIALVRPADRDSYHYKGLVTCGSVWVCPLCAAKIQERRRLEVVQAIAWASSQGKATVMVSLTFPHRVDQPLALLLKLQQQALAYMRGRRQYAELMGKLGHIGRIRALEVTHGDNGWHPHTHELLFVSPEVTASWLREELSKLWLRACRKVGLFREERDREEDFLRHAVDVQVGNEGAGEYLAKLDDQRAWGISHELTKASSKQGRRAGKHPFRLAAEPTTAALWMEYVNAMKGGRQLVWSRGLKAAVGVTDKSDQELAAEDTARALDRIPISFQAWRYVLGNDARWELTREAKLGGAPAVSEFLILLGYEEPT